MDHVTVFLLRLLDAEQDAEDFGAALSLLRERRDLTQASVADRCGMSQPIIAHFEAGRRLPSLKSLYQLRAGLGCSWDELLGAPNTSPDGA